MGAERRAIEIYTDGACSGNPGPGGWGAVLRLGDRVREISGGEGLTTNNRMELTAAIEALLVLRGANRVELYTDSTYLKDGITRWLPVWERNGWRTSKRKPVKNADLWRRLVEASRRHDLTWRWVRGHSGDAGNERADALARRALERFRS